MRYFRRMSAITLDLANRVSALMEKNRSGSLSSREEEESEGYQFLEHLVRMAKTAAYLKLGLQPPDA